MAAHGYPKSGAWCGEFAASVVRAAGGTPPRNPEVASNWRNFGQQVATPQPGDVAVRRQQFHGRLGSGATGATGSHVTIVGGVQGGTFTGIGGNQGRIVSQFQTGQYEFFRGGGAGGAGMAGGGMQMPGAGAGAVGGGGGGGLAGLLGGGGGGGGGFGGGGGVSGQATVNIMVTVPQGAQVSSNASGSGILANPTVTTSRAGQMTKAGQNASVQPNYYGNEY
jgi:hypothetical protein